MAYASAEPGCVGAGVIVPSHMASKPSEIEDPDSKPISRELRLTAEPHRRRTQVGENIPRSETYNSNCDAIAAAALSTRTITMLRVAKTGIDFLEPWYEFVPDQANAFLRELKCELAPDHPLYNIQLQPLGHSGASDNAIFQAADGRVFQVHLTFSGRAEKIPLPRIRAYANTAEWIQAVMLPASEDYRG